MHDNPNSRPIPLYVLGGLGFAIFLFASGSYWFKFGDQPISNDPAAWGMFGDYLAGTVGPLVAFLAFIGLLWTIHLNQRELRYTRDELTNSRKALQQNNSISEDRAYRERLEAQKDDVYRVIQPITKEIESLLNQALIVPDQQAFTDGHVETFSGKPFIVRDLLRVPVLIQHRHLVAGRNDDLLRVLGEQIQELERYLRAYERLAGTDFFAGYYKPRYQGWIPLLIQSGHVHPGRQQAVMDYFQEGVDVLTSAESSISEVSELAGTTTTTKVLSDSIAVTDRIKSLVTKEVKSYERRDLPYVLVRTYPDPNNPSARLADVTWAYASSPPGGIPPQVDDVRGSSMSQEDAMNRGFMIANTYGFPRLYWERRETNMRLWKLAPIDITDRNWAASTYNGEAIIRAEDEQTARRLAARAYGIATSHTPGEEVRIVPWDYAKLVTAVVADPKDSYTEDGEAAIVGPTKAVTSAHPEYNR